MSNILTHISSFFRYIQKPVRYIQSTEAYQSFIYKKARFKFIYPRLYKLLKYTSLVTALFCFLVGSFVLSILLGFFGEMPDVRELKTFENRKASEMYTADTVLMGKFFMEVRTKENSFENLPKDLVNALLATEDIRFYQHDGIDLRSSLRVFFKSLLMGNENSGGGSTLSQQLAKNIYPRKRYGRLSMLVNKTREMLIASRLENAYSKNEIITLYLNTVSFGEDVYGIGAASRRYFSTIPDSLKLEESALLIGLLKAPTLYNPRTKPKRALQRRNTVLEQMNRYNFISAKELEASKKRPLVLKYDRQAELPSIAPHLYEKLKNDLRTYFTMFPKEDGTTYDLYSDGLKIYTTIDSEMQKYAENAVEKHLASLQTTFEQHWGTEKPWGDAVDLLNLSKRNSIRYKELKRQGRSEADINKIFNTPVRMKIFTWQGEKERVMSPNDSIKYHLMFLNAGFMVLEAKTGFVRSYVGSIDFRYFQYDHTSAMRQAGSTFKPFVYASALEDGADPCHYYYNYVKTYPEYDDWSPGNADGSWGGSYAMEGALINSMNTISAQLILRDSIYSVQKAAAFIKNLGFWSPIPEVPSIALGSADVTLQEMMAGYAAIANDGKKTMPVYVTKIVDRSGKTVYERKNNIEQKQVMASETARMMTKMLKSVINYGTGSRIKYEFNVQNDIAGKTGTSQMHSDGWFMTYTPDLVLGAWVGGDDRRVRFRDIWWGQGATMALPICGYFLRDLYATKKYESHTTAKFPEPSEENIKRMQCPQVSYTIDSAYANVSGAEFLPEGTFIEGSPPIDENGKLIEQIPVVPASVPSGNENNDLENSPPNTSPN